MTAQIVSKYFSNMLNFKWSVQAQEYADSSTEKE